MEASNVQKDVKPHIVLIDGVKYYSDKPETCRSCFFWKNRKIPCILGQENCYYLAEIIQSEQQKKCEGCCYASGRSCVSATCYKDLMMQFNASKDTEPKEGAANARPWTMAFSARGWMERQGISQESTCSGIWMSQEILSSKRIC